MRLAQVIARMMPAALIACGGSVAPAPAVPPTAPPSGGDDSGYGYEFDVDTAANASGAPVPKSLPLAPGGRLYPEAISGIVRIHFGALLTCYQTGLTKDPKLSGLVVAKYVFGEDGITKQVSDGGSTLPDKDVVACILDKFQRLQYPPSKSGDVSVRYPIQLSPGDLATSQPTR